MAKIYASGNYVIVEDGDNLYEYAKGHTLYLLVDDIFYIKEITQGQYKVSVADLDAGDITAEDSGDVYTVATFTTFLRENTGFKTAPGGSGAEWGSITGTLSTQSDLQSALDSKQDDLVSGTNIKTINGNSLLGGGDLIIGGSTANPSVIAASYADGTTVTGTTTNTISQSLLIPANTFGSNGMLEVLCRANRTSGNLTYRIYKNTTNSLTGATQIATLNVSTSAFIQAIRTFRVNTNVLSYLNVGANITTDYGTNPNLPSTTSFVTSVDQYIIFAIQPATITDSAFFDMARAVKYI
jgi:hypothetical protein